MAHVFGEPVLIHVMVVGSHTCIQGEFDLLDHLHVKFPSPGQDFSSKESLIQNKTLWILQLPQVVSVVSQWHNW